MTTPKGWWKLDAYTNGYQIIIVGDPPDLPENDPLYHDCDAMGCGWDHVLVRIPIMKPIPELRWIEGKSDLIAAENQE